MENSLDVVLLDAYGAYPRSAFITHGHKKTEVPSPLSLEASHVAQKRVATSLPTVKQEEKRGQRPPLAQLEGGGQVKEGKGKPSAAISGRFLLRRGRQRANPYQAIVIQLAQGEMFAEVLDIRFTVMSTLPTAGQTSKR